jgi:TonB family protein
MTRAIASALTTVAVLVGAPDDKPLRAWVDVPAPNKLQAPPASYPRLASQDRVQALVVVEVTVDPKGRPTHPNVVFGHPLFDDEMLSTVRKWSYEPTVVDGRPRSVVVYEPYLFTVTPNTLARDIGRLAAHQRNWPWALDVKLWAVANLSLLVSTQRDAAVGALQALAGDKDERVATRAKAALAEASRANP